MAIFGGVITALCLLVGVCTAFYLSGLSEDDD